MRWHPPTIAPLGCGRIIACFQHRKVVGEAVVAIAGIVAVFGQRVAAAHTILIGGPVVGVLRPGLAPGEVIAVIFRRVSPYVAGSPQEAAGQTEIDILMSSAAIVIEIGHQGTIAIHGKDIIGLGRNHTAVLRPVGEGVVAVGRGRHRAGLSLLVVASTAYRAAVAWISGNTDCIVLRISGKMRNQGSTTSYGECVICIPD